MTENRDRRGLTPLTSLRNFRSVRYQTRVTGTTFLPILLGRGDRASVILCNEHPEGDLVRVAKSIAGDLEREVTGEVKPPIILNK